MQRRHNPIHIAAVEHLVSHEIDQILQQDDTVVFNISGSQILFTLTGTKALVRPLRAVPLHALDRFLVIHLHGGDVHSVFIGQRCD